MQSFESLVAAMPEPEERLSADIDVSAYFGKEPESVVMHFVDPDTPDLFRINLYARRIASQPQFKDWPEDMQLEVALMALCWDAGGEKEKAWLIFATMVKNLSTAQWIQLHRQFIEKFPHFTSMAKAADEEKNE